MRIIRSIVSSLALAAMVILPAWLLLRWGRLGELIAFDWTKVLVQPDDGGVVLGVLTVLGWAAWAAVLASIGCELATALSRGRLRPRVPGMGWLRPLLSLLVASMLGAAVIVGTHPPAAPVTGAPLVETLAVGLARPAEDPAPATPALPELDGAPPVSSATNHLVQAHDDLWTLAQRYLGDGGRWREIYQANRSVLVDPDLLPIGVVLSIPLDPQVSGGAPDDQEVTVRPGDSLWTLAEQHLGDPMRWTELRMSSGAPIADPDHIEVGWRLRLPAHEPVQAEAPASPTGVPASPASPPGPEPTHSRTLEPEPGVPVEVDHADADPGVDRQEESDAEARELVTRRLGPLSATLALGLSLMLAARRAQQLRERPLGRRLPRPEPQVLAFDDALDRHASSAGDDPVTAPWQVNLAADGVPAQLVDLATAGVLGIGAEDPDDPAGVLSAIACSLLVHDEDFSLELVLAGSSFDWLNASLDPRVSLITVTAAHRLLAQSIADRRQARPPEADLAALRADPDLAGAWAQQIVLIDGPLPDRLDPGELGELGISVVGLDPGRRAPVHLDCAGNQARLDLGAWFPVLLVTPPARRALGELFEAVCSTDFDPAPWWSHETVSSVVPLPVQSSFRPTEEHIVDSVTTHADNPLLLLLGPVELIGARGPQPPRALKQCAEYCAWILLNPARTATTMANSLIVAEGTRRSNMSRLRTWLGADDLGEPYLPDAYSGHIQLHPLVSSDWEMFTVLIAGGVNRAGDSALIRALELVRGAPLADAAPGQWHWAEPIRLDMVSTIRDTAVMLAGRALGRGDLDLAGWALQKGWLVAPDDDLLTMTRIRIEHARGNRAGVESLVLQVTRRARTLGTDLGDEMVTLLQEVMEGTPRTRQA